MEILILILKNNTRFEKIMLKIKNILYTYYLIFIK